MSSGVIMFGLTVIFLLLVGVKAVLNCSAEQAQDVPTHLQIHFLTERYKLKRLAMEAIWNGTVFSIFDQSITH